MDHQLFIIIIIIIIIITVEYEQLPWYKKGLQWICGIEKMGGAQMSPEQRKAMDAKHRSIHETKTWRRVLNINAIILMTLAVFVWGFFA